MCDEVTKSENVSASRKRGDAITASPRPWRIPEVGLVPTEIWSADGTLVARGVSGLNASLICDAVNGRERLRADLRSLADEFDGYAEEDGIRAPAYASLFRSLAERLRGMVEVRSAAAPLGRPATEEEVDGGKAKWCHACVAKCPLAGRDALAFCERFEEGGAR